MQIDKIKLVRAELYVIFTGDKYFFYNNYYGLIGIARRLGYSDDVLHTFELAAGNEHTMNSDLSRGRIISNMKLYINKNENKYIQVNNTFIDNNTTLNHWLSIIEVEWKK